MLGTDPQELVIICMVMVVSLTFHEVAHARTALAFGDPTAKLMGRVSLNPLRHLDLMGAICFILSGFGWAKPVPVNPANLHPPRLGNFMVSLAGPMANLGLAAVAAVAFRVMAHFAGEWEGNRLVQWLYGFYASSGRFTLGFLPMMIILNVGLAIFNLIPLFPLDGHHLQREVLPADLQGPFMYWQVRFGAPALLGLMIMPKVLSAMVHHPIADPLNLYFNYVGAPLIHLLIGT